MEKNAGSTVGGSGSIELSADGKYRWIYEYDLFKNPGIFILLVKAFSIAVAALIAFMLLLMVPDLVEGYAGADDVLGTLRMGGIFLLLFLSLAVVGYLVYAAMMGGKYCALFTMDEEGVEHRQLPKQFKKAQAVGALNVLAGLASGSPTQVGIGLTSARQSMGSSFDHVRSVKGSRFTHTIKVNELLGKNQVYVESADYDFVFGFIRDHCPNAKKVRG